jgi:hypothetical protein
MYAEQVKQARQAKEAMKWPAKTQKKCELEQEGPAVSTAGH